MMKNAIVGLGVVIISTAYLWLGTSLVPERYALMVNFLVLPAVLGMIAGYLMVGGLITKLVFLLVAPIVHVLVFGGDPAKPGIENLLALVELVPLFLGCSAVHLFLAKKRSASAPM
jgi:hypothetical protein